MTPSRMIEVERRVRRAVGRGRRRPRWSGAGRSTRVRQELGDVVDRVDASSRARSTSEVGDHARPAAEVEHPRSPVAGPRPSPRSPRGRRGRGRRGSGRRAGPPPRCGAPRSRGPLVGEVTGGRRAALLGGGGRRAHAVQQLLDRPDPLDRAVVVLGRVDLARADVARRRSAGAGSASRRRGRRSRCSACAPWISVAGHAQQARPLQAVARRG